MKEVIRRISYAHFEAVKKLEENTKNVIQSNYLSDNRSLIWKLSSGVILFLSGTIMCFMDPLSIATKWYFRVEPGSMSYSIWKDPPLAAYHKFYIFNITNAEEFMSGLHKKIKFNEVGPFMYRVQRINDNLTINNEKGSMEFYPRDTIEFLPDESLGDPKHIIVTVPNLPLLAGASMIASQYSIWVQISFKILIKTLKSKPVLTMTVHDYFWGYDDSFVTMANTLIPGWVDFSKFGLLDRSYRNRKEKFEVEIRNESRKYSMISVNGIGGFEFWGFRNLSTSTACNRIHGTYEGIMFHPDLKPDENLRIFVPVLCRTVPTRFMEESLTSYGVRKFSFKIAKDAFDQNEETKCMCLNGKCLPRGLSNVAPCAYTFPLAASWPHYKESDPDIYKNLEGISPDTHQFNDMIDIQPDLGLPLAMKTALQTNIVMSDVSRIETIAPFSNLVIPGVWSILEMQELADDMKFQLRLLFVYAPVIAVLLKIIIISIGLIIILVNAKNLKGSLNRSLSQGTAEDSFQTVPLIQQEMTIFSSQGSFDFDVNHIR